LPQVLSGRINATEDIGKSIMDDDWLTIVEPEPFVPTNPRIRITPQELLRRYAAGERDFERVIIYGTSEDKLVNAILSGINLRFAKFDISDLTGCNLSGADLTESELGGVCMDDANLSRANLTGANLYRTHLHCADLSYANLSGVETYCGMIGANLTGAILRNANLEKSVMRNTNLTSADLTNAILGSIEGVSWSGVRFDNTIMPDGSIRNQ
jgi:uncharacterized protein YjbI with pentapeptide repeats